MKKKCDHHWFYVHTVYGNGGDGDPVTVLRHCEKCKRIETAESGPWKPTRSKTWRDNVRMSKGDFK